MDRIRRALPNQKHELTAFIEARHYLWSFKPHLSNQSFPGVDMVQEPAGDTFHGCWFHVAE
jgi:hypothetical protein